MIHVNPKKPIRLKNRTKYFDPDSSRSHVQFSNPNSYESRRIKIEGYETRLYWQFRYCEEHDGQTFFYTLTYNDKSMPKYMNMNCFDYEDLRDLLTGGFRKMLLRKYGSSFKYFIGAELGDGKGQRGMHNNPHYHVLFFLESANNPKFPYVKISSIDFRHLVRMYWQGFDEDVDGYRDYNEAKYGIAKEGENTGKVTDFRACMYCAKYVCKDVKLKKSESDIEKKIRFNLKREFKKERELSSEFHKYFFDKFIRTKRFLRKTHLSKDMTSSLALSDVDLIEALCPNAFDYIHSGLISPLNPDGSLKFNLSFYVPDDVNLMPFVTDICREFHVWKEYWNHFKSFLDDKVRLEMNTYRNRYCNKCRISHGVGDYALEHIKDKMNPSIQVPSKRGFKSRPISMYYYRKLYTEVQMNAHGHPIRTLTQLGIDYRLSRLPEQIKKMKDKATNNLFLVCADSNLFDKMRQSDVNVSVTFTHDAFLKYYDSLLQDDTLDNILQRYAEYKLVYEDRFFSIRSVDRPNGDSFPAIDVKSDYSRFLAPTINSVCYSNMRLDSFLESNCEGYLPYSQHPYFLCYISLFAVLDLCTDYFFIQSDNKAQIQAEEIAATKRFHNQQLVKEFYRNFV